MRKRQWIFLGIILTIFVIFLFSLDFLNGFINYDVKEEELGVEEDFFDFNRVIPTPNQSPTDEEEKSNSDDRQEPLGKDLATEPASQQTPYEPTNEKLIEAESSTNIPSDHTESSTTENKANVLKPEEKTQMIYNKYYPSFVELENLAVERVDKLFSLAIKEYEEMKGNKDFSKTNFAAKYVSAANKLQEEVDKVFYQLVNSMEKELISQNLPTALVKEAKLSYKARIREKKDEMISKFLKN